MIEPTTFTKFIMSNIWTLLLTVTTMLWCIPAVTSQEQPPFSLAVSVGGPTVYFNFTDVMFHKFYHCLRNRKNDQCEIQRDNFANVISIRGCLPVGNSHTIDELTCKPLTPGILCKRGSFSDASQIVRCPGANFHDYEVEDGASLSSTARTIWLGFDIIFVESHISGITVQRLSSPSQNQKFVITGTFTTTLVTLPTTPATTKRITTISAATKTSTSIPSASPTTPATSTGSRGTSKQKTDNDGDDSDDNTSIIIGAAVGGTVVVIIVVALWRRKVKSSSSSANNNKREDTDISPYENTNLKNVNSNLNPYNLNNDPNEHARGTFATVDPSENPNSTKTSPYYNTVNNDNDNKSEQTKTQFNPSLDYIEIDENTEASHYQRISDVNNDQGIPTSGIVPPPHPSDPSAKPRYTYYNVCSETGQDPSETCL